jgi:predicted lipoprotein with Yx(FWY)xxD motif
MNAVTSGRRIASWLAALMLSGAALADAPAGVVLKEHGHGWVLVDKDGMSLYTTVKDQEPGKSACNDQCAAIWPPLKADDADAAKATGDWSIITRADGSKQWAFGGQPVYRYSRDVSPGDSYGNDVDNEWTIATKFIARPVSFAVARNVLGYVLTDARSGTTLYYSDKDKPGKSTCEGECLRTWTPQKAPLMATDDGDWTVLKRADGIRQWAYKGRPLYRYVGDLEPGEANGHELEKKRWQVAILEPAPPVPAWVSVWGSDAGDILADAKGKTLYGRTAARARAIAAALSPSAPAATTGLSASQSVRPGYALPGAPAKAEKDDCGFECPGSPWSPVLAGANDKAMGNWSVVDRKDGKKQWAFKGEPLYTHVRDTHPGTLNGVRSGDRSWHALMRSGRPMQGTGN